MSARVWGGSCRKLTNEVYGKQDKDDIRNKIQA